MGGGSAGEILSPFYIAVVWGSSLARRLCGSAIIFGSFSFALFRQADLVLVLVSLGAGYVLLWLRSRILVGSRTNEYQLRSAEFMRDRIYRLALWLESVESISFRDQRSFREQEAAMKCGLQEAVTFSVERGIQLDASSLVGEIKEILRWDRVLFWVGVIAKSALFFYLLYLAVEGLYHFFLFFLVWSIFASLLHVCRGKENWAFVRLEILSSSPGRGGGEFCWLRRALEIFCVFLVGWGGPVLVSFLPELEWDSKGVGRGLLDGESFAWVSVGWCVVVGLQVGRVLLAELSFLGAEEIDSLGKKWSKWEESPVVSWGLSKGQLESLVILRRLRDCGGIKQDKWEKWLLGQWCDWGSQIEECKRELSFDQELRKLFNDGVEE